MGDYCPLIKLELLSALGYCEFSTSFLHYEENTLNPHRAAAGFVREVSGFGAIIDEMGYLSHRKRMPSKSSLMAMFLEPFKAAAGEGS